MRKNWIYRRGDIYMANLNPFKGSEQGGTRPVIVIQNNRGNYYCPTLIIAPLTSKLGKHEIPTHYSVKGIKNLPADSVILLEQIKTIDKLRIKSYVGKVSKRQMEEIEKVMRLSLGIRFEKEEKTVNKK